MPLAKALDSALAIKLSVKKYMAHLMLFFSSSIRCTSVSLRLFSAVNKGVHIGLLASRVSRSSHKDKLKKQSANRSKFFNVCLSFV